MIEEFENFKSRCNPEVVEDFFTTYLEYIEILFETCCNSYKAIRNSYLKK